MTQPWRCEMCHRQGLVECWSKEHYEDVKARAKTMHETLEPMCPGMLVYDHWRTTRGV
jgi:hypothetical protein